MATITTELIAEKRDSRGRHVRTAGEREAYLRAFRESGLTQAAFAKREGLKYMTLVSWVQAAKKSAVSPRIKFAELTMPAVAKAGLEARLADGTVVCGREEKKGQVDFEERGARAVGGGGPRSARNPRRRGGRKEEATGRFRGT
jgi:hypothetical protein